MQNVVMLCVATLTAKSVTLRYAECYAGVIVECYAECYSLFFYSDFSHVSTTAKIAISLSVSKIVKKFSVPKNTLA
jgi:hypothetical protein